MMQTLICRTCAHAMLKPPNILLHIKNDGSHVRDIMDFAKNDLFARLEYNPYIDPLDGAINFFSIDVLITGDYLKRFKSDPYLQKQESLDYQYWYQTSVYGNHSAVSNRNSVKYRQLVQRHSKIIEKLNLFIYFLENTFPESLARGKKKIEEDKTPQDYMDDDIQGIHSYLTKLKQLFQDINTPHMFQIHNPKPSKAYPNLKTTPNDLHLITGLVFDRNKLDASALFLHYLNKLEKILNRLVTHNENEQKELILRFPKNTLSQAKEFLDAFFKDILIFCEWYSTIIYSSFYNNNKVANGFRFTNYTTPLPLAMGAPPTNPPTV